MDTPVRPEPELTTKLKRLVRSRYGLWILGLISFVESSLLLPIVVDPFLVMYVLGHRSRALVAVVVTIITSVMGGIMAFLLAYFFQSLVFSVVNPEILSSVNPFVERFRDQTFFFSLFGSIVLLPYTLIAMAAGFMKANISMFILGAILGRTIRFGFVGYLTYLIGSRATMYLKRHLLILGGLVLLGIIVYALWT